MNIPPIEKLIPQRYPFLLIDKIIEYSPRQNLIAIKNITSDEWSCSNADVESITLQYYPEAFIIEGAAQSAAAFFHLEFQKEDEQKIILLGKVSAEFFGSVGVGDQIHYKTTNYKILRNGGFIDIVVECKNVKVAEVKIFCGF